MSQQSPMVTNLVYVIAAFGVYQLLQMFMKSNKSSYPEDQQPPPLQPGYYPTQISINEKSSPVNLVFGIIFFLFLSTVAYRIYTTVSSTGIYQRGAGQFQGYI